MSLARAVTAKSPLSLLISLTLLLLLILVPLTLGEETITNETITNSTDNPAQPISPAERYEVVFSDIYQEAITIEEPVRMYQTVHVTNTADTPLDTTLALANYVDVQHLEEALSMSIHEGGEEIATSASFPISLEAGQDKEYIITYTYPAVHKDVVCTDTRLQDILPRQAQIQNSDLPPETVLETRCHVRIHHDGDIHYYDITVPLDEIDPSTIASIYYVEGDTHLEMTPEGTIALIQ